MADFLIWQDKEVLFDISKSKTELKQGELFLSQQDHIEDKKGNPGEAGTLTLTNMRMIWYQRSDPRVNLSIVVWADLQTQYSNQLGNQQILNFKAHFKDSKFEFIFKSMIGDSPKIFTQFQSIHKSYQTTKLYRELKSRGGDIVKDKNLILLPIENIINKYANVLSVGQDQAQKGFLFYTNVRIVWYSQTLDSFNISIPWVQIKNIDKKKLKQGPALIIETLESAGGYIVGYLLENLDNVVQEGQKLMQFHQENPVLGIELGDIIQNQNQQKGTIPQIEDDIEIVDIEYNQKAAFNTYATNLNQNDQKEEIIYSQELGLAMEKPQDGKTVEDLWKIIKISK